MFISCFLAVFLMPKEGDTTYFEVGLLGPELKPIVLGASGDSSEVRELATWLSDATGFQLTRRDRRT